MHSINRIVKSYNLDGMKLMQTSPSSATSPSPWRLYTPLCASFARQL
jgi:hypothetical protein